jgi:hypothetical protein
MLGNPFSNGFSDSSSFGDAISLGESAGFGKSNLGGGGFGMDPLTLGLGVANIGASLFGGINTSNAQRRAAEQQAAAAKYAADAQAQAGRDVAKANLGQTMFGALFGSREKDLDIGRQFEVAMLQAGPLGDAFRESKRRDMQAEFGFKTSAPFKEAQQRANLEQMKQNAAQYEAKLTAFLGPKAPTDLSRLFTV